MAYNYKIKVCGMTDVHEISQLNNLGVDYIGIIFYDKSPRSFPHQKFILPKTSNSVFQTVGVFVNSTQENILLKLETCHLDCIQLHGEESPEYCEQLKQKIKPQTKLIKAFGVGYDFSFEKLEDYTASCSYFLFDTKGEKKGGNGISFNWQILVNYSLTTPFFISGGIGNENIAELLSFHHPYFYGIDVNSKLEISPGKKNISQVAALIKKIRS